MHVHGLPEDILVLVLERALAFARTERDALKTNLPLLSVCQRWRHAAAPMVYKYMYVQYGEAPDGRSGMPGPDPSAEEPADAVVKTNMELISAAGCISMVRRADLVLHYLSNPFPGSRDIVQRMRAAASQWQIQSLTVYMVPASVFSSRPGTDISKHAADIAETGDALAELMPGIRQLSFQGTSRSILARALYGRLAGFYGEQLRKITSRHPITVPQGCRFKVLKSVYIDYDCDVNYCLPSMESEGLVSLSLLNGPPNHSWAPFSAGSSSPVIEFTKLRSLDVAYNMAYKDQGATVHHRDGHPWELRFPNLTKLRVSCTEGVCPLLEYAVLPPSMDSITIDMNSACFHRIAESRLPRANYFAIRVDGIAAGGPNGLSAINRVLECARGSTILDLSIKDHDVPVLPESITCVALTSLLLSALTPVDTALAFIRRLPCLAGLTFYQLDLSDVQTDLSIPSVDDTTPVAPLHSKLRRIAVNFSWGQYPPETAVSLAKYLLLGIPTLVGFTAGQTPRQPVMDFVEAYTPSYQHLGEIDFYLRGE